MSQCGQNNSDTLYTLWATFFVFATFSYHLWSIIERIHDNMESMHYIVQLVNPLTPKFSLLLLHISL